MRSLAKIISAIFDPILLLPIIISWQIYNAYIETGGWLLPGLLFVVDLMMPGLAFIYFMSRRHFRDWDVHRVRLRFPMFLVNTLCQGTGLVCALIIGADKVGSVLGSLWLVVLIFMGVSLFWKISVHTGMMAVLAFLMIEYGGWSYGWTLALLGLVAWSRVVDRDHTWFQVIAGAGVPLCIILMKMS
jgi:hypothetical protein